MKDFWEQLAHFVLLGAVLGYAVPPLAIAAFLVREFAPKPWGQWPPGTPRVRIVDAASDPPVVYYDTELERVEDLKIDAIVTLSGAAVGTTLALIWPWWGFL